MMSGKNVLLNGGNNAAALYEGKLGNGNALSSENASTTEPLYEQTTNFGHLQQQQLNNYHHQQLQQQQMVNRSPLHQARVNLLKQLSNENLLAEGGGNHQSGLVDPSSIYGFVKGPPNSNVAMFKTLARASGPGNNQQQQLSTSSNPKQQGGQQQQHHLYQLPDQAKAEAMMTLKRAGGQQTAEAELIEINGGGPLGPVKLANSYMTTFGLIRASENCFE